MKDDSVRFRSPCEAYRGVYAVRNPGNRRTGRGFVPRAGRGGSAVEGRPGQRAQVGAILRIELAEVVAEFERRVDRRPQVILG